MYRSGRCLKHFSLCIFFYVSVQFLFLFYCIFFLCTSIVFISLCNVFLSIYNHHLYFSLYCMFFLSTSIIFISLCIVCFFYVYTSSLFLFVLCFVSMHQHQVLNVLCFNIFIEQVPRKASRPTLSVKKFLCSLPQTHLVYLHTQCGFNVNVHCCKRPQSLVFIN